MKLRRLELKRTKKCDSFLGHHVMSLGGYRGAGEIGKSSS